VRFKLIGFYCIKFDSEGINSNLYIKLINMKKKIFCFIFLIGIIFSIRLFGQQLQNDTVKTVPEILVKHAKNTSLITDLMPVVVFIFVLVVVFIPFYFNFKKIKGRQSIISQCIEKGKEIPDDLLSPQKKNIRSDFHKGIISIALGLGISLVLIVLKIENNFWTIGLIPIFIGIAYLISQKYDKPGGIT
jgi:hypothetical protein